MSEEYTGGSSSYYVLDIVTPKTLDRYQVECLDIIEALDMRFGEGEVFKAIWRRCAARQGRRKRGYDNGLYDAEKVAFYGKRLIAMSNCDGR